LLGVGAVEADGAVDATAADGAVDATAADGAVDADGVGDAEEPQAARQAHARPISTKYLRLMSGIITD
jgi:hypothetical protein